MLKNIEAGYFAEVWLSWRSPLSHNAHHSSVGRRFHSFFRCYSRIEEEVDLFFQIVQIFQKILYAGAAYNKDHGERSTSHNFVIMFMLNGNKITISFIAFSHCKVVSIISGKTGL